MLQKKLIINSVSLLIDVAGRTKNKELIHEVTSYFHLPIYKVYRFLSNQTVNSSVFNCPDQYFEALCDAEEKICEMKIKSLAQNDPIYENIEKNIEIINLSNENLLELYPKHATSLFSVVQSASDRIAISTNPKTKTRPKNKKIKKV